MTGFGQGVIYFDGSNNTSTSPTAPSEGSVFFQATPQSTPVLDTATDINVELLYGSSSSTVDSAVVTLLLSSGSNTTTTSSVGSTQGAVGDITDFGTGQIYDVSGNGYQLLSTSSGATEYFEVLAWTGNYSTYQAAVAAGAGVLTGNSGVFSEVLTSNTGQANDIENMPALVLSSVPEPGTMALAGLGSLSLFLLRRKK